ADDQARVFRVADDHREGKPLFDAIPHLSPHTPAFSNQDRWLLTFLRSYPPGEDDFDPSRQIDWRDAETGKRLQSIPFNGGSGLVVSPDGKHFAAVGYLGARLGDVTLRRFVGQPMPDRHGVPSCAFSPDGRMLLTVSNDGSAQLWSVPGGQPV